MFVTLCVDIASCFTVSCATLRWHQGGSDCVCGHRGVTTGVFMWGYYRNVAIYVDVAPVRSWCMTVCVGVDVEVCADVGVGRTVGVHMNVYLTGGASTMTGDSNE